MNYLVEDQTLAERLHTEAFYMNPDEKHSPQYLEGSLQMLYWLAGETSAIALPYDRKTPEADAFLAGMEHGRKIWKRHIERNR